MSPYIRMMGAPLGGFPRVSGDEPKIIESMLKDRLFSPRERG